MNRVAGFVATTVIVGLFAGAALADASLNRQAVMGGWDAGYPGGKATFDLEDGEKHSIYKGKTPMTYRVCNVGKAYTMNVVADGTPNELDPDDCWDTEATDISATNQGSLPANARVEGTYHRVLGNQGMGNVGSN